MKDEKFKKFIKEHIDHSEFDLWTEMVSKGYGMDEHNEPRVYARCSHDEVLMKTWLKK